MLEAGEVEKSFRSGDGTVSAVRGINPKVRSQSSTPI
jgi:hypothetical protein